MNDMDKAAGLVSAALDEIEVELEAHRNGNGSVGNEAVLSRFRTILQKMKSDLAGGCLPPKDQRNFGMGRVVTDSWPYDSKLGALILSAEQAYRAAR